MCTVINKNMWKKCSDLVNKFKNLREVQVVESIKLKSIYRAWVYLFNTRNAAQGSRSL
jgi:hypothetical protein